MGYGIIKSIEEIGGFKIAPVAPMNGEKGARLGMGQMINAIERVRSRPSGVAERNLRAPENSAESFEKKIKGGRKGKGL